MLQDDARNTIFAPDKPAATEWYLLQEMVCQGLGPWKDDLCCWLYRQRQGLDAEADAETDVAKGG